MTRPLLAIEADESALADLLEELGGESLAFAALRERGSHLRIK